MKEKTCPGLSFAKRPLALAASTLFMGASALAAPPGTALGPPFAALDPAPGSQTAPSIARAANGSFVAVWTQSNSSHFGRSAIFGRRFAADGAPLDDGFQISGVLPSFIGAGLADVAMSASGDFIVVWTEGSVLARRYAADGTPAGAQFPVDPPSQGSDIRQRPPAVAADDAGDFVVAWQQAESRGYAGPFESSRFSSRVMARRFDRTGAAQGPSLAAAVEPNLGGLAVTRHDAAIRPEVDVAMDRDGNFALAWADYDFNSIGIPTFSPYPPFINFNSVATVGSSVVKARRYERSGRASGLAQTVKIALAPFATVSDPAIAMAANGDYLVAWKDLAIRNGLFVNPVVHARRYDRRGLSSRRTDLDEPSANMLPPAIAASPAGSFVVSWEGLDRLQALRYDADGHRLGPVLPVDGSSRPRAVRPAVAIDALGNFALAWQQGSPSAEPASVQLRLFAGP